MKVFSFRNTNVYLYKSAHVCLAKCTAYVYTVTSMCA